MFNRPVNVPIRSVFEIPARTIPFTTQSGGSTHESPSLTREAPSKHEWQLSTSSHGHHITKGPPEDGRWDTIRSEESLLNKGPLIALLFHHVEDKPTLSTESATHLSDILARISAPMLTHPTHLDGTFQILRWNNAYTSFQRCQQLFNGSQ